MPLPALVKPLLVRMMLLSVSAWLAATSKTMPAEEVVFSVSTPDSVELELVAPLAVTVMSAPWLRVMRSAKVVDTPLMSRRPPLLIVVMPRMLPRALALPRMRSVPPSTTMSPTQLPRSSSERKVEVLVAARCRVPPPLKTWELNSRAGLATLMRRVAPSLMLIWLLVLPPSPRRALAVAVVPSPTCRTPSWMLTRLVKVLAAVRITVPAPVLVRAWALVLLAITEAMVSVPEPWWWITVSRPTVLAERCRLPPVRTMLSVTFGVIRMPPVSRLRAPARFSVVVPPWLALKRRVWVVAPAGTAVAAWVIVVLTLLPKLLFV